jgi:hypothetical protein
MEVRFWTHDRGWWPRCRQGQRPIRLPAGRNRGTRAGSRPGWPLTPMLMLPTRRTCRCRTRAGSYPDEHRVALVPPLAGPPSTRPGKLADIKGGATSDSGYPQPQAAEVGSARLPANDARQALLAAGLSDAAIDRLTDDFNAEDRGEATDRFIDWAIRVDRAAARRAAGAAPGARRLLRLVTQVPNRPRSDTLSLELVALVSSSRHNG